MRAETDERLARRAAQAHGDAFATIFQRYNQEIYRFCLSILGNVEDARDAMQNTMFKALQALPGEERQIKLRPWLYRVAHNQSIDLLRRRREVATIDPELAAPGDGLAETAARRERLQQLLRDLAELPERQRAALLMRELGGLEFEQIGEAFGTSPEVARQTVYEARVSLREFEGGREMSCEEIMYRISNGDRRALRKRDLQAHLRTCADCRNFRDSIDARRHDLTAIAPLPAVVSAGILHSILGSSGAGVASGATTAGGATVAAGAGKAVTAGLVAKSVATVAVVAAVGVSAANRTGLIDTPLPSDNSGGVPSASQSSPSGGRPASATESPVAKQADGDGKDAAVRTRRANGMRASGAGADGRGRGAPGAPAEAAGHGQETAAIHRGGTPSHGHRGSGHGSSATHRSSHSHVSAPRRSKHPKSGGGSHRHAKANPPPQAIKEPSGSGAKQPPAQSPSGTGESSSKVGGETKAAKTNSEVVPDG